jgi:hypothetical protein
VFGMPVFGVRDVPFSVFGMRRFRRSPWSEIRSCVSPPRARALEAKTEEALARRFDVM